MELRYRKALRKAHEYGTTVSYRKGPHFTAEALD